MKDKIAAIGTFDGVHRGHREVLGVLSNYARENDLEPIAITFDRHPLAHIDPERQPSELTPLWKKKNLLKEVGVLPLVLEFNEELRINTAEQWLRHLHEDFSVRALVIGYDNTFGSDGINLSLENYVELGEKIGIKVIPAKEVKGVSSSAIRKAVTSGNVEKAAELLGRPYSITSKVVGGNHLGHTFGFPTANIALSGKEAIPKAGVYAGIVKTLDDGKKYPAMINVGTRPTLMRGNDLVIEAHLLGYNGDLYGKDITVRFLKRIREEQKFESINALRQQLEKDRKQVQDLALL